MNLRPPHADDYYDGGATKKRSDASHPWTWPYLGRGLNYYGSKELCLPHGKPFAVVGSVDHSLCVRDALPPKSGQGQAQPRE